MIEMIAGIFGLPIKDGRGKTLRIKGMGPDDGPFSTTPEREAELVKKGLARYVTEPFKEMVNVPAAEYAQDQNPIGFDEMPPLPEDVIGIPEYSVDMKVAELREIGAMCGLTFKVGMSKADMVAALDAHLETNVVDDDVFDEDGEPAPEFDAAEAVL